MLPVQETSQKVLNNLLLRVLEDLIPKSLSYVERFTYLNIFKPMLHWPCSAIKNYTSKYCATVLRNKSTSSHTVPSDFYNDS